MPNVSSGQTTKTRHWWSVPCPYPQGGEIKELSLAIHLAAKEAEALGVSTSTDDWLHVDPQDDTVLLWFETDSKKETL